jgi:hypothetical protein
MLSSSSAFQEALHYIPLSPTTSQIAPSMIAVLREINVLEPTIPLSVLEDCWHYICDTVKVPQHPSFQSSYTNERLQAK